MNTSYMGIDFGTLLAWLGEFLMGIAGAGDPVRVIEPGTYIEASEKCEQCDGIKSLAITDRGNTVIVICNDNTRMIIKNRRVR